MPDRIGSSRLIDAPELLGAGMHVHERLPRFWHVEKRVTGGRHLAEARTDHQQQIGTSDTLGQGRVDADADVARVTGRGVVDRVLPTERRARRKHVRLEERLQVGRRSRRPPAAADDCEGALGRLEQAAQGLEIGCGRAWLDPVERRRVGGVAHRGEHVLGKGEDDRPGPARAGGRVGARDQLGDAVGVVDLGDPLRERPEHPPVVDLLKRLTFFLNGRHLPDEQDHRCRVLERRMHADRRMRRAWPARDHANARTAGQLAVRLGHVGRARLVAAGHKPDRRVVEAVEQPDVALARNAVRDLRAVNRQLVGEQLAAGAAHRRCSK